MIRILVSMVQSCREYLRVNPPSTPGTTASSVAQEKMRAVVFRRERTRFGFGRLQDKKPLPRVCTGEPRGWDVLRGSEDLSENEGAGWGPESKLQPRLILTPKGAA